MSKKNADKRNKNQCYEILGVEEVHDNRLNLSKMARIVKLNEIDNLLDHTH